MARTTYREKKISDDNIIILYIRIWKESGFSSVKFLFVTMEAVFTMVLLPTQTSMLDRYHAGCACTHRVTYVRRPLN